MLSNYNFVIYFKFVRKGRQLQTKETSFVSAMTAAGIIYSIARDCSRGQLKGCGCRNSTHSGTVYGNASFPVHCLDNLVYAEKVAAEFLQSLELESKDSTAAINLHNFVVGKEVSWYKWSLVHTFKLKLYIAVGLDNFKVDHLKS